MFRHFYKMLFLSIYLVSFVVQAKAPRKDWGLIVFLNGHNNLDSFGDGDVAEMLKAKDTSNIHVVVLHASMNYGKTRLGSYWERRRFFLERMVVTTIRGVILFRVFHFFSMDF